MFTQTTTSTRTWYNNEKLVELEKRLEAYQSAEAELIQLRNKYHPALESANNAADAVKDLAARFLEFEKRLEAAKVLNHTLELELIQVGGQYDQLRLKLRKEST